MANQGGDPVPGSGSTATEVIGGGQGQTVLYPSSTPSHHSWSASTAPATVSWNYKTDTATENGYPSNSGYYYDPLRDIPNSGATQTNTISTSQNTPNGTQDYSAYGYTNPEYQNYYYNYHQPTHDSSSQQLGATQNQNTGAAYQPLSSFQNSGSSYVGPTSYLGTYYNTGDNQNTAGYQNNSYYYHQPNPPHSYSSYSSSDANSVQSSTVSTNPAYYQQQYYQWPQYYSQNAPSLGCTPGTENSSVTMTATSAVGVGGGYSYPSSQPPPPGTTSWRRDAGTSTLPSLQEKSNAAAYQPTVDQEVRVPGFQSPYIPQMPSYSQNTMNTSPLPTNNPQNQQNLLYSQPLTAHVPPANQALPPQHTVATLDTHRVSKMQIPTNPRIASGLALGVAKSDKENSTVNAAPKPAYVGVSGAFPVALRAYVERTFARCKNDAQRAINQSLMKEMVTKASADGTLFTKNWDMEPLFPLPIDSNEQNNLQSSDLLSSLSKSKSSGRRTKSRWEPAPEEKLVEKPEPVTNDLAKVASWSRPEATERAGSNTWKLAKFLPSQQQTPSNKFNQRPAKKSRFSEPSNVTENGDASSDSDKEQSLTKYYAGAISLANNPEEKKRREHRFKRFEKVQDDQRNAKNYRAKDVGGGSIYTRRASAMLLAKTHEDGASREVEDIDWDALTVKGTCQEIEKRYLRLTSAPDPSTVRPEDVLEKSLHMVQTSPKNYLYKCDQLKSIRQDLTVQRIQNGLTVKVYETHARLALQAGDLPEYNQCQSQLKRLYADGIKGCHMEFSAYNLLCIILHSNNKRELSSLMTRLSAEAKENEAVKHALAVQSAVSSGNYVLFFRLYKTAPNLNTCLMDLYIEKMRFEAVKCMSKSYRPTVPVKYISRILGFSRSVQGEESEDMVMDKSEECEEWLRAHGAVLTVESNGELHLDAKASSSSLYMPEPEDAVAHGDANLAVDDFFTRAS
ncbi:hypothetical protein ACMD2_00276 [Ananas comosus]|uniref:PCI domain-containing protein n=1 Tax=Ananas comosus TaxID=4615 RepID=A0A199W2Y4_ANACO|nr:hypothetical protein ACMD2_00276 [Ananas comosus]